MSGWISLHRKILDWEWYDDSNVCRLFIHCLLKANHQPKKWKGIDIARGQFITSLERLSSETGLSVSQIRTCLKKLKSTGEIASKSHTQHTVITIVSYDNHQGNDKRDDKPIAFESQTNDKQIATTNNDNKENNENNKNKGVDFSALQMTKEQLSDLKAHRQKVKAPLTQRAVNGLAKQLELAKKKNWTIDDVLDEMSERGWKSFKAEWIAAKPNQFYQQQPQESVDRRPTEEDLKSWLK